MNGQAASVVIDNISKRFGRTLALDQVSFDIRDKELFAILGPNGAGKSTLIMILCTLLRPDSGTASIAGFDVLRQSRQARKQLGVVFQEPSLDTRLTVEENLDFHGLIYEVPAAVRRQRITELLELVELSDWRKAIVRTLSAGMKRRVEIARALMHDSRVVVLDEPTVGLDAQSRAKMWDYLHMLRQRRELTLIVTTHYIEEVDSCDRVCVIDYGKVMALDSPDALRSQYGEEVMRITPRDAETAAAILAKYADAHAGPDGDILLKAPSPADSEAFLAAFGQRLRHLSFDRTSLESVFLNLTGRAIRDSAERHAGQEGLAPRSGAEPRM